MVLALIGVIYIPGLAIYLSFFPERYKAHYRQRCWEYFRWYDEPGSIEKLEFVLAAFCWELLWTILWPLSTAVLLIRHTYRRLSIRLKEK